jgi:hypothetical protein
MYYFDSICYAMDMNRTASPDKIKSIQRSKSHQNWMKNEPPTHVIWNLLPLKNNG